MFQKPIQNPLLSPSEKAELLQTVTGGADAVRLRKWANALIRQYQLRPQHDADDLLQEARRQFMSEERERGLDFVQSLMGGMRGKAGSWFRQKIGRKEDPESETENFTDQSSGYDDLVAKERYLEIHRSLHSDPIAQRVLAGVILGHKGEYLLSYVQQEFPEVDKTVLASKRKKILRHIEGLES